MARPTDKGLISKSKLTAIGAALRKLFGGTKQYTPDEMASAINGIEKKTSSDLVVSGQGITTPAGYYASPVMATVKTGTIEPPIVERRGIISDDASIVLRAKVTVKEGYVSSGTSVGPYEYVYASELVSGTLPITANGTHDVTKYASVNVNVPQPLQFDTWILNGDLYNGLASAFVNGEEYTCYAPILMYDGSLVTAIKTRYYEGSSTDEGYLDFYFSGNNEPTRIYEISNYSGSWTQSQYQGKTIQVPSFVRQFTSTDIFYPQKTYANLYKLLKKIALLKV